MTTDFSALKTLRTIFLGEGAGGTKDYWSSDALIAEYDRWFATRIGWKWDGVLEDIVTRGFVPPAPVLVDWGAGTGIATRKLLARFPGAFTDVHLIERSSRARNFAAAHVGTDVKVHPLAPAPGVPFVLLASHVLGELDAKGATQFLAMAKAATAVLIVEPGTPRHSGLVVRLREELRSEFTPAAPCPHTGACGLLAPDAARHWCHFFAKPPNLAFTDGDWRKFATELGIDLRSLPVTYLWLARQPATPPPAPGRLLGRARPTKGVTSALVCTEQSVHEARYIKSRNRTLFKEVDDGGFALYLPAPD